VLKDAKDISQALDGWGLGADELQKMPINQKLELCEKVADHEVQAHGTGHWKDAAAGSS